MRYGGPSTLILGLARGGVIVADAVADKLNAELDVLVARKVGSPESEELGVGAVTADSGLYLNEEYISTAGITRDYLETEIARQREVAATRERRYRRERPRPEVTGRTVLLVDDGLATGATMIAAARSVRSEGPARLVIAVPVGPPETCEEISPEADEVVCLLEPRPFWAVGAFYLEFDEVTDEQVVQVLDRARSRVGRA